MPKGIEPLIDLIQHADISSANLQAIRSAAADRLSRLGRKEGLTLREEHEMRLREVLGTRFPFDAEPSIQTLRQFLGALQKLGPTLFEEKNRLVKCAIYWKNEFGATFWYEGSPCVLKCDTTRGPVGRFRIRTADKFQASIYSGATFPRLQIRVNG